MILIGDHQPPAAVSGEGATWNVPVHVVTSHRTLLNQLMARGFRTGWPAGPPAISKMHALLPTLLDAFGTMTDRGERRRADRVGLCASCAHVEVVSSSKGSTFYLCRLPKPTPASASIPCCRSSRAPAINSRHNPAMSVAVTSWESASTEYDARIRTFIPDYEEMLDVAAAAVPRNARAIVDLGTGTGRARRAMPPPRSHGPARRHRRRHGDPEGRGATAGRAARRSSRASFLRAPIPRCDVIVSSFALHHVRTRAAKAGLYTRLRRALTEADDWLAWTASRRSTPPSPRHR